MLDLRRRQFIALLGGAVAWPLAARAQQSKKVPKIGILSPGPPTPSSGAPVLLLQVLRELGYVQGRNLAVEMRWAGGHDDRLPELADDLVRAQVDVRSWRQRPPATPSPSSRSLTSTRSGPGW
jgi:putative tryptophan/tyrosine transport system substrate-binding protein